MIASLRRWHRVVFVWLAVLMPLLLALALLVRRPMPVVERLPSELVTGEPLAAE